MSDIEESDNESDIEEDDELGISNSLSELVDNELGKKSTTVKAFSYNGDDELDNELYSLINRSNFVDKLINNFEQKDTFYFMPNDICEGTSKEGDYIITIFGILPNGAKTELVITNIEVFFDVLVINGSNNGSSNGSNNGSSNLLV